jgi:ParB/RepB/Spo0J family partition protein
MPEPRPYSLEQYMALPEFRGLPRAVREYHARQYQRWLQEMERLHAQSVQSVQPDPDPMPTNTAPANAAQTSLLNLLNPEAVRIHRPRTARLNLAEDILTWPGQEQTIIPSTGLLESVREFGILFPVIVQQEGGDRYQVVDGRRRIAAALSLNVLSIPALIFRTGTPDGVLDAILLSTNNHRAPNPLSESDAVVRLVAAGLDQGTIARRLNLPVTYVNRRLSLAALRPGWRDQLATSAITLPVAERIAQLLPQAQDDLRGFWQGLPAGTRLTANRMNQWLRERHGYTPEGQGSLSLDPDPAVAGQSDRIVVQPTASGTAVAYADPIRIRIGRPDATGGIFTEARLVGEHYVTYLDQGQVRHLAGPEIQPLEDTVLSAETIRALTGPSLRNGETIRVEVQVTASGMTQGMGTVVPVIRQATADWRATVILDPSLLRDWVRAMDGFQAAATPDIPAEARAALAALRLLNIHGGSQSIARALTGPQPLVEVTEDQERQTPGTRAAMERLLGPPVLRPNRAPSWVIPRLATAAAWAEAGRLVYQGLAQSATHVTVQAADLTTTPGLDGALSLLCGAPEDRSHRAGAGSQRWRLPLRNRTSTQMAQEMEAAQAAAREANRQLELARNRITALVRERDGLLNAAQILREEVDRPAVPALPPVTVVLPGAGDVDRYQPGQGYASVTALLTAALEDLPAEPDDRTDSLHSVLLEGLALLGQASVPAVPATPTAQPAAPGGARPRPGFRDDGNSRGARQPLRTAVATEPSRPAPGGVTLQGIRNPDGTLSVAAGQPAIIPLGPLGGQLVFQNPLPAAPPRHLAEQMHRLAESVTRGDRTVEEARPEWDQLVQQAMVALTPGTTEAAEAAAATEATWTYVPTNTSAAVDLGRLREEVLNQTTPAERAAQQARARAAATAQAQTARQAIELFNDAPHPLAATAQWGTLLQELTDQQPADSRVTTDRAHRARRGP